MIGKHKSLIGNRYGKLKVINLSYRKNNRIYWECLCDCGNTVYVITSNLTRANGGTKSCGCINVERLKNLTGQTNPSWKGGRFIDDNGYVQIWAPNNPNAKKTGYIREHRLMMSNIIGRPLLKNENVHHINGNKLDNSPVNLELWNTYQPAGQRVEDKIKWAKEILELYGKQ